MANWFARRTLRQRLYLLVLACLLPVMAVDVGRLALDYRTERARASERLAAAARGGAVAVQRELQVRIGALQGLAVSRMLQSGDLAAFHPQALEFLHTQPPGSMLGVFDRSGTILIAVGEGLDFSADSIAAPRRRNAAEATARVFESGQPVISDLRTGALTGQPRFSVDVPVRRDGATVLDLGLSPPLSSIQAVLDALELPAGGIASVIDGNGMIVARRPAVAGLIGHPGAARYVAQTRAAVSETINTVSAEGVATYASFQRVPGTTWTVGIGVAQSALLSGPLRAAGSSLGASLVALLVGLLLARMVLRRIAGPIAALQVIASADIAAPTPAAHQRLELAEADAVAQALQRRRDWLHLALEAGEIALFNWEIDTDVLTWDARAQRIWGHRGQHIGAFRESLHPDDRAEVEARVAQAIDPAGDGAYAAEYRVINAQTGAVHWVSARGQTLFGQGTRRMIGVVTDTTARRAIEAERARLLNLLDLAAIIVRDFDGTIRFWSKGCETLYGYSAQEALGRTTHALLRTVWPVPLAEIDAILLRDGEWSGELRHTTRDGRVLPIAARKVLQREAEGKIVLVIESVTDMSALRAAENALLASETRLALARDAAGLGVWDADCASDRITPSAQQWRLLGRTPNAAVPTWWEWLCFVHPDDRDRLDATLGPHTTGRGERAETEYRVIWPDGSLHWLLSYARVERDAQGHPLRLQCVDLDISTRKAAEQVVAETMRRLRLAHRMAGTGSFEWQLVAGRAEVSEEYAAICGLPPGALVDTPAAALRRLPAATAGAERRRIAAALAGRAISFDTEVTIRRPDRALRTIAVRAEIVRRPDGRAERVRGVIRDVTEERRLQRELRQLNETLERRVAEEVAAREEAQSRAAHAERMQALGQLAGGIAHDINNVLQAISSAASLLSGRLGDDARQNRLVQIIAESVRRGTSVTSRLLALSRRSDLRAEPIDPAALLEDVREILAASLGSRIAVAVQTERNLPALFADRGQLETALVNLAVNARDAMPEGGRLTIRTGVEVVEDAHPAGLAPGRYVRIEVADTGQGMTAEVLTRIGQPFFTTKPRGKGTGLGVAMVRGFVEQSGGGFAVSSTPGSGTSVTLWLPQARRAAVPPDRMAAVARLAAAPAPPRVLLADDEELVRETLVAELAEAGCAVIAASSGEEALALLRTGDAIDALVTDLAMPGINGLAVIAAAQARHPGLPSVLMTGHAEDAAAAPQPTAGRPHFTLLHKPVSGAALVQRLATLLGLDTTQG